MPKPTARRSLSQARTILLDSIPEAYWPGLFPLCRPDCTFHSVEHPVCPSPGKTPNRKGFTKTAVEQYEKYRMEELDVREIREQAAQWIRDGHNLGLVPPPNIVVLDADDERAVKWVREHRPDGAAVQGRKKDSEHTWLAFDPEDWPARNKSYKLDIDGKKLQVDLRCPGKGFVVVPPSMHVDGKPYKWRDPLPPDYTSLPTIPDELKEPFRPFLTDRVKPRAENQIGGGHDLLLRYVNRLCRYSSREDEAESLARIRAQAEEYLREIYRGREDRAREMLRQGGELDLMIRSGWDMFGGMAPLAEDASDQGIADLILAALIEPWLYIEELGGAGWRTWDGARWVKISEGSVRRDIGAFYEILFDDAMREGDADRRERLMRMANHLRSQRRVQSVFSRLRDQLSVSATLFDTNPWLATFPGSEAQDLAPVTVDLRDGRVYEPDPDDYVSKIMGVPYNPEAESEVLDHYLETAFPDASLRSYVQCALGLSLPGTMKEEAFYFLHGSGGSGKGTLLSTAMLAFGDYGAMASPGTFSGDGPIDGSRPEHDLIALKGKRFVFVDEISDVRKIGTRMKDLTGGAYIVARAPYGSESVTFMPQHTVWLAGNQQPRASAEDSGIWRRAREIPMNAGGALHGVDPTMKHDLQQEKHLIAFMAWVLRGAEVVRANDWVLDPCAAVEEATLAFREASDPIAEWYAECIVEDAEGRIPRGELLAHYQHWMDDQYGAGSRREMPRANPRQMAAAMRRRGADEKKVMGVRVWVGVRFRGKGADESAPSGGDVRRSGSSLKPRKR